MSVEKKNCSQVSVNETSGPTIAGLELLSQNASDFASNISQKSTSTVSNGTFNGTDSVEAIVKETSLRPTFTNVRHIDTVSKYIFTGDANRESTQTVSSEVPSESTVAKLELSIQSNNSLLVRDRREVKDNGTALLARDGFTKTQK